MLTPAERKKESDAEKRESDGRYDLASSDWETIGENYAKKGHDPEEDCCYLCEAARAFGRAASDYKEAGKRAPKDKAFYDDLADKAFVKAAKLFLECGDDCFERGEFACALAGYAQAEAYYAAIEKKANTSGDKATGQDAKKKRKHAKDASDMIDKLQKQAQKEESQKLIKSLKFFKEVGSGISPRIWLGARFDSNAPIVRGTMANSPALRCGMRPGDQITKVGESRVESTGTLSFLVKGLPPWRETNVTVRRQSRNVRLRLVPAVNVYSTADHLGALVNDRRCDDDCACETPRKNVACATSYRYNGEGPNGGVMLLLHCAAMTAGFEILDEKECGPYEFF